MKTEFGEAKQCPFCAYDGARFEQLDAGSHKEYAVMCTNCGAFGPNDLGRSGALEMWNLRRDKFPGTTLEEETQAEHELDDSMRRNAGNP